MFYHYSQNNSGGIFDFDRENGITHHVVIEAESASLADRRAESIGREVHMKDTQSSFYGDREKKKKYTGLSNKADLCYPSGGTAAELVSLLVLKSLRFFLLLTVVLTMIQSVQ